MPPAARITDMHTCPMVNPGPVPHVGGPVNSGSGDVLIGYQPAARAGDKAICVPAIDSIAMGSPTVLINDKQAARLGDPTNHGGVIVVGCPTVLIGSSGQGAALVGASKSGSHFCEECEKARKAAEAKAKADAEAGTTTQSASAAETKAAAQPGDTPAQRAARKKVAEAFYEAHCPNMSLADIDSHVRCIDLSQPVEVVQIAPGDVLFQHGAPGKVGQYFAADATTTAHELGVHSHVLVEGKDGAPSKVIEREKNVFVAKGSHGVQGLKSKAAPALDDRSIKGEAHQTSGGGTQIMVPRKHHHAFEKK